MMLKNSLFMKESPASGNPIDIDYCDIGLMEYGKAHKAMSQEMMILSILLIVLFFVTFAVFSMSGL